MRRMISLAATAGTLLVALEPCIAAEDIRDLGMPEHRAAMFAGAQLRLGMGGAQRERPTARLQLGVTHSYQDRRSASPATVYRASAFELGASRRGAPAFSIAGADSREFQRRLGMSTGGAIAIGALAVVGLVAVAFAAGGTGACEDGCGIGD